MPTAITAMPPRIARLARDPRGYPIPWNVMMGEDGTPFFTVNDDRKHWRALREELCPICGERLGRWRWFVGGPRSAYDEQGAYLDLPAHRECSEYALAVCPYLAMPKYMGRIDIVHPEKLPSEARILLDETIISERPEVFVAVMSDRAEAIPRGTAPPALPPYLKPLRPYVDATYWRHGRRISEKQAMPYLRVALGADWTIPALREE